jgi:rhodanese-related sulfurtransferase
MHAKKDIGFISSGVPNVTPNEALNLCKNGAIIIDVRLDYMIRFKQFGVENTLYFPINICQDFMTKLNKDTVYIVAETSTSIHTREVVKNMIQAGFLKTYNLAGGLVEWERLGMPVKVDIQERLSGSCMCQLKAHERNKKK